MSEGEWAFQSDGRVLGNSTKSSGVFRVHLQDILNLSLKYSFKRECYLLGVIFLH